MKRKKMHVNPDQPLKKFTPRQQECLFWMVRGMTLKQTAKQLAIAPHTVETHLERIKHKLAIDSKHDVIQWVFNKGLVRFDDQWRKNEQVKKKNDQAKKKDTDHT